MNASSVNVIHAVWLDPYSPVSAEDRAQLDAAGISLETVATLGDLTLALRRTHLLIIRLGENADLLQEVQTLIAQLGVSVPVLCRVERRRIEVTVQAMRMGALHVLAADDWTQASWRHATEGLNAPELKSKSYVFVDPISQHLLALAERVAQTEVTALLVGPTGAGKEVLARVLHEASNRSKGPFVALNCAAMPEHLIEDMLFGHEKGAFTGAHKDHRGLFEQAHGGTIFLDEIGEMPMQLQAKLLRVLQEKKLNRLGSEATVDLDVRVIAATNKDLKQAIEQREFREDLYFRISTFRLRISPLKDRPGDIVPLTAQMLARNVKDGVPYTVTPEAQRMMIQYNWPGNVRELENVVQRAMVLCSGHVITPAHLMFDEASVSEALTMPPVDSTVRDATALMHAAVSAQATQSMYSPSEVSVMEPMAQMEERKIESINLGHAVKVSEQQAIVAAIQSTDSRIEAAAKLGISPRTLRYKIAQLRQMGLFEGVAA